MVRWEGKVRGEDDKEKEIEKREIRNVMRILKEKIVARGNGISSEV